MQYVLSTCSKGEEWDIFLKICIALVSICVLCTLMQVFPAHGAGSPCGKNISSDLYSTIGKEKLSNVALSYDDVS